MKDLGTVGSVSEYLSLMDSMRGRDFYYRGESEDFGETRNTASIFRPIKENTLDKNGRKNKKYLTDLGYRLMAKEYYAEMNKHNKVIRNNFMAYCQHHGLPTPLLDVSTSPLVALYFACKSSGKKEGRVYLFNSDKFVELNQQVLKYRKKLTSIDPFSIENMHETIDALSTKMMGDKDNRFANYVEKVVLKNVQDYLNSSSFPEDSEEDDWKIELKKLKPNLSELRKLLLDEDVGIFAPPRNQNIISKEYVYYVENYIISKPIHELVSFERISIANSPTLIYFLVYLVRHTSIGGTEFFPDIYFTVKTSVNFERVKAQSGRFMFQVSNDGLFYAGLSLQNKSMTTSFKEFGRSVPHDGMILVDNQKEILSELDHYGVNQKSLFMDDDSIASYIKWELGVE